MNLTSTAIKYAESGLSVIPCLATKNPTISWTKYQTTIMDSKRIDLNFNKAKSIGIICGKVSGNIEVIDVDTKHSTDPHLFTKLWEPITDHFDGQPPVVLIRTISGGYHIIYKCKKIEGPQKLAVEKGHKEACIETKGEGGYIIAAPSKGYEVISGDYTKIPEIYEEDRDYLMTLCKSFHHVKEEKQKLVLEKEIKANFDPENSLYDISPWDAYNMDTSEPWKEILLEVGWTQGAATLGKEEKWIRPGSENKSSATFNYDLRLFYNFSPNGGEIEENKAHTPTSLYTALKCNGNFSKASNQLFDKGYGKLKEVNVDNYKTSNIVFKEIISGLKRISFKKYVFGDGNFSPQKKHLLVAVNEILLEKIKNLNYDLCTQESGSIFFYANGYWKEIKEKEMRSFLGTVAEKLGVYKYNSKHYSFRNELLAQFESESFLAERKKTRTKTLLNVANGTLEISSRGVKLREFDKKDLLKYKLEFSYDPRASCPMFQEFLNEVLPTSNGVPSNQMIIAEYLGYCFLRNLKIEKVLYLTGGGANGKGVLFDIVKSLLGESNVSSFSINSLTTNPVYRANLEAKLLNFVSEMSDLGRVDTLKQLISGEPIDAKRLYKDPFIMRDYARLMFAGNKFPKQVEHTHAFWRRFIIIPFNFKVTDEKKDIQLAEKIIKSEMSGVLNWVIDGIKRLSKNKDFTHSPSSEEMLNKFKTDSDVVKLFIDEYDFDKIDFFKNKISPKCVRVSPLFEMFSKFANYKGLDRLKSRHFVERLQSYGCQKMKDNQSNYFIISDLVTNKFVDENQKN